jgi:dynein heavy chain
VVQTYETVMARHSTMIVGPSGGGKTVVIQTLAKAQTSLGITTDLFVLNPKVRTCSHSRTHLLFVVFFVD